MNYQEELNEFLARLFEKALNEYETTKEYEMAREKRTQLEAILAEKYPFEQKEIIDNCYFQLALDAERKAEFIYRKGLKNCVDILKVLGVLA